MFRPKDTKERTLHRLKIAQGHLKKVMSMVESDEYCIDIIHQNQAVQNALKEIDKIVLEQHLECCTIPDLKNGQADKAIKEIMEVFNKK